MLEVFSTGLEQASGKRLAVIMLDEAEAMNIYAAATVAFGNTRSEVYANLQQIFLNLGKELHDES